MLAGYADLLLLLVAALGLLIEAFANPDTANRLDGRLTSVVFIVVLCGTGANLLHWALGPEVAGVNVDALDDTLELAKPVAWIFLVVVLARRSTLLLRRHDRLSGRDARQRWRT